jgi:thiol-disulfide isomerase/thioredoxin
MKKQFLLFIFLYLTKASFGQTASYDPDLALDFAKNLGKLAPNFVLQDEQGRSVSLSQFKGKTVYLHFWAEWCGVCVGELPDLKQLQDRTNTDELVIINIAIDSDKDNWKKLISQHQIPGINLLDTKKSSDKTRSDAQYGFEVAPAYVLIGKDGKFLGHDVPAPDEEIFVDWVIAQAINGVSTKVAYEQYAKNTKEYTKWLKENMSRL